MHAPQDIKLTGAGPLGVGNRVVGRRRLRETGEHGGLRHIDLGQRFAEVDLGRCGKAVGALTEEDLVDVELQDLILGQIRLDLIGKQDLAKFASERSLTGEEEVPCDLHRNRAGALLRPAGQVSQRCAQDRDVVDPAVLIKPLVFRCENRLPHDFRDVPDLDHRPALLPELPEQLPFGRDDPERDLGLVAGERLKRGQSGIKQGKHEGNEQAANHRQAKQDGRQVDKPPL